MSIYMPFAKNESGKYVVKKEIFEGLSRYMSGYLKGNGINNYNESEIEERKRRAYLGHCHWMQLQANYPSRETVPWSVRMLPFEIVAELYAVGVVPDNE